LDDGRRRRFLSSEPVQRLSLALEGVHDVHRCLIKRRKEREQKGVSKTDSYSLFVFRRSGRKNDANRRPLLSFFLFRSFSLTGNGLAAGVFGVRDAIADDVLEEDLEDPAGFLVDEAGNALDAPAAGEAPNRRLGNPLDVVPKDLPVALRPALA